MTRSHRLQKMQVKDILFLDVVIDAIGVATGEISPAKAVVNTVVAGAAVCIGGWAGLAIGLVYWGLDTLGAFELPAPNGTFQRDPFEPQIDNLRVVIPRYLPQQVIKLQNTFEKTFIGPTPYRKY